MQAWWLAKKREEKCNLCNKEDNNSCPTNEECLLVKDIISSRLDILAIITVIKNQFPELYNDISLEPQFLSFILCKFLELKNCEVIENSQYKYLAEKYKEEGFENYIFAKKYANLQSYLSSIQNISIPEDIKPFIMLLQDPLEREIGGNSVSIYNSLITQNTQKFKDLLGINENTHNLSESQILQLNLVLQSINRNEDKDRLEKAYLLLSKFIDLYCCDKARLLVNDIAKALVDKDFIQHLGTTDIRKLLNSEYISNENINKLYLFLLSRINQSKPILKEDSAAIFKEIIQIGLELHYNNKKLNDSISKSLLKIFNDGKYKYISDENKIIKEEKIDILFYIENIKTYGESLLIDLNLDYILDLLEFLNNNNNNIDIETYISQIDFILHHNKANKKGLLESIFNNGIANNQLLIVDYFEKLLLEKDLIEKINLTLIPEIIDSFVQRIIKHYSGKHALNDIKNKIRNLIKILNIYKDNLTNIIESNIKTLIDILSKKSVDLFEELFDKYQQLFPEQAEDILISYTEKIFITDETNKEGLITLELFELLHKKYFKISQNKTITELLSNIFEDYSIDIDELNIEKYKMWISNLNENFLQEEVFKTHLSSVYENLELSLSKGDESYFNALIHVVIPFFEKIKTPELDSLLSYINKNYLSEETSDTEKFYNLMKNNWPKEDNSLLPNYNIENIANNMLELVKNTKVTLNKKEIFESIYSILEKGGSNTYKFKSTLTNALMWLWNKHTQFAYDKLLEFKHIMICGYNFEWLSDKTAKEYDYLLENYWREIFNLADSPTLIKRTENYIKKYNNQYKGLWCKLLYEKYKNLNILSEITTQEIKALNDSIFEQIKFFTNEISKNYNDEAKKEYAKALFNGYIAIENSDYKRKVLVLMKKLLDRNATGFFTKVDFEKAIDKRNNVKRLLNAFPGNLCLKRFSKELFPKRNKK